MFDAVWKAGVDYARAHPVAVALAAWAFVRAWGVTVRSGSAGVLYTFGRARKVLEPGLHLLLPVVQDVRTTPVRSVSLDLPRQRVTTADGLVYDADATIVFRVADPARCLTEVDDVNAGCRALLPLVLEGVIRGRTRESLADRRSIDAEFTERARAALARWGVEVEQAGLVSIAPTAATLRLTQLRAATRERERVLRGYVEAGLSPETAVALLGGHRRLVGKSAARYRKRRRPVVRVTAPAPVTPPTADEDWLSEFA